MSNSKLEKFIIIDSDGDDITSNCESNSMDKITKHFKDYAKEVIEDYNPEEYQIGIYQLVRTITATREVKVDVTDNLSKKADTSMVASETVPETGIEI